MSQDLSYIHVCNVYRAMLKGGGIVRSCKRWSINKEMFKVIIDYIDGRYSSTILGRRATDG